MGQHASSLRAGLQDDYDAALARRGVPEGRGAEGTPMGGGPTTVPNAAPPRPACLSLSEVASLRSPSSRRAWDVGAITLPLMMVLDSDRDGTVSLEELASFATAAATVAAAASSATGASFAEAVRGAAALAAAAELGGGAGGGAATAAVAAWVVRLAVADDAVAGLLAPRAGLVSRAAVAAVVGLLVPPVEDAEDGEAGEEAAAAAATASPCRSGRPEPPGFGRLFDALQAAAEAGGQLDPLDACLDGWLPAASLGRVAEGAAAGAAGLWGRVVGRGGWEGVGARSPTTATPLPPLVRALGIRE